MMSCYASMACTSRQYAVPAVDPGLGSGTPLAATNGEQQGLCNIQIVFIGQAAVLNDL